MKVLAALACFTVLLLPLAFADTEGDRGPWNSEVDTSLGKYAVSVTPKQKKIEVKPVDASKSAPQYLRVRLQRENDRPLEIHLKTVERPGDLPLYTGVVGPEMGSLTGLELEFSFDKKTWKRLGKVLKKLVP